MSDRSIELLIGAGAVIAAIMLFKKDKEQPTSAPRGYTLGYPTSAAEDKTAKTVVQEKNENATEQPTKTPKPAGNAHVTDAPAAAIPDDRKVEVESAPAPADMRGIKASAAAEEQRMKQNLVSAEDLDKTTIL